MSRKQIRSVEEARSASVQEMSKAFDRHLQNHPLSAPLQEVGSTDSRCNRIADGSETVIDRVTEIELTADQALEEAQAVEVAVGTKMLDLVDKPAPGNDSSVLGRLRDISYVVEELRASLGRIVTTLGIAQK